MSAILLILAFAGFLAIGAGVGLVRNEPRPALTGDLPHKLTAWFATLAGRRLLGAALVAVGVLVFVLVLVLRP